MKKYRKAKTDVVARTKHLALIKRPKKEDKPVDTNKKVKTKNKEVTQHQN